MLNKARENLEAAGILRDFNYYNGAVNRAYYAAYQAAWHFLVATGLDVPATDGNTYWPHRDLIGKLEDTRFEADYDWAGEFESLRQWRAKADYYLENVKGSQADKAIEYAERFIGTVEADAH